MKSSLCFLRQFAGLVLVTESSDQNQSNQEQDSSIQEKHSLTEESKDEGLMGVLKGFFDKIRGKGKGADDTTNFNQAPVWR